MCPTILPLVSVLGHSFTTSMFAVTYMYFSNQVMIKRFLLLAKAFGKRKFVSAEEISFRRGEISSAETKFPLSEIIS